MSNAKRPATRQHTRTTEAKRNAELDQGIRIDLDGQVYEVRAGDLTALDTGALRRATGLSFLGLLEALGTSPDIDLIAAVVWLSRRLKGERGLPYEAVAEEMGYDVLDRIELAPTEAEEAEGDPEG